MGESIEELQSSSLFVANENNKKSIPLSAFPSTGAEANHICFLPGYFLDQLRHSQEEQMRMVLTEMLLNDSTSAITKNVG